MSQMRRLQKNSCFQIFMLRLFVTWVLRYAGHSWSRFGHLCSTLVRTHCGITNERQEPLQLISKGQSTLRSSQE